MIELIKELANQFGPCGLEDRVAEFIYNKIKDCCDKVEISPVGSVIATVKGSENGKPLVISCGMDETTFVINDIDGDGFLKLKSITNHDPRGLCGRYVSVGNEEKVISGVMSSKVLHLASGSDTAKPSLDKMFIDIGKNTGDLAKEVVNVGDFVTFAPNFSQFGKDKIKGKALDSRVCCALLIKTAEYMKENGIVPKNDIIFAFNVKEKCGKSTAFAVANKYGPDCMFIISCHSVTEYHDKEKDTSDCKLGKGVVIPTHDDACLYFGSPLYRSTVAATEELGIKTQLPSYMGITSSAANSETVGSGVSVVNLSLPCLNIRTANEIISMEDISSLEKLIKEYILNRF